MFNSSLQSHIIHLPSNSSSYCLIFQLNISNLIHHAIIHFSIIQRFISCVLWQNQAVFICFFVLDKVSFLPHDHEGLLHKWSSEEWTLVPDVCARSDQNSWLDLVLFLKDFIFKYQQSLSDNFAGLSLFFLSLISPASIFFLNYFLYCISWNFQYLLQNIILCLFSLDSRSFLMIYVWKCTISGSEMKNWENLLKQFLFL